MEGDVLLLEALGESTKEDDAVRSMTEAGVVVCEVRLSESEILMRTGRLRGSDSSEDVAPSSSVALLWLFSSESKVELAVSAGDSSSPGERKRSLTGDMTTVAVLPLINRNVDGFVGESLSDSEGLTESSLEI